MFFAILPRAFDARTSLARSVLSTLSRRLRSVRRENNFEFLQDMDPMHLNGFDLTDPQAQEDTGNKRRSTLDVGADKVDEPVPESDGAVPASIRGGTRARGDERIVRRGKRAPVDVDQGTRRHVLRRERGGGVSKGGLRIHLAKERAKRGRFLPA